MNIAAKHRFLYIALTVGAALVLLLAIAAGLGMLVSAAPAATPIYVRTDGDDTLCNGEFNDAYSGGAAPNCAVKTVQQGIYSVTLGGTVIVGAGVYAEDISVTKDLTLQGSGAGSTIIDGGGSTCVYVAPAADDVTVSGVTIRNGGGATHGAGIRVASSGTALTLTDSTVSNNTSCSGCNGAGLDLPSGATGVISNCSFVNNTTGGGNAVGGGIRSRGALTVVVSTFTGNEAYRGGAIYGELLGNSLTVIDSTFSDNRAVVSVAGSPYGGAIYHDSGRLTISNTTIISNSSSHAGGGLSVTGNTAHIYGTVIADNSAVGPSASCNGGGIRNYDSTLIIEDSVLRDNRVSGATSYGGGIFSDGRTTLKRVTVSGNSSGYRSGGIHSQEPLTMANVTISGNSASDGSGGLQQTGLAPGILLNCTIADNTVTSGTGPGGLRVYSAVSMTNVILAYNDNANCAVAGNGVDSYGHNLEDGDSCDLGATGDITGTDPLLGPLGYYGCPMVGSPGSQEPMYVRALRRNSPAIDQGGDVTCLAVDQRGVSRPVDGDGIGDAVCDIGAFEFDLVNDVFLPLVLRNY